MAKRRDSVTRSKFWQMVGEGRSLRRAEGYDANYQPMRDAFFRVRGRRGVRARARAQRIAQAQNQPNGGTITNS